MKLTRRSLLMGLTLAPLAAAFPRQRTIVYSPPQVTPEHLQLRELVSYMEDEMGKLFRVTEYGDEKIAECVYIP